MVECEASDIYELITDGGVYQRRTMGDFLHEKSKLIVCDIAICHARHLRKSQLETGYKN